MAVTGTMLTEATTVAIGTAVITTVATTAADTIRTTRPSLAVSRFQYLSLFRFLNKRSGSWLLAPGSWLLKEDAPFWRVWSGDTARCADWPAP
jgi:hypothetical protein